MNDPHLDALIRIMPPEHGADEQVDWDAVEAQLGTRLPGDYRAFMAVYGAGTIGDALGILRPLPADSPYWKPVTVADETASLRQTWEMEGGPPGTGLASDAALAWGLGTITPDLLGWLMAGSDPDQWPVVVWRRQVPYGTPTWALFECGMVAFLERMMLAQLDECPMSNTDLWGSPRPFVHWREEQRRSALGLDPTTGEPA